MLMSDIVNWNKKETVVISLNIMWVKERNIIKYLDIQVWLPMWSYSI